MSKRESGSADGVAARVAVSALTTRLRQFFPDQPTLCEEIDKLPHRSTTVERGVTLLRASDRQDEFLLVDAGWLARCRETAAGRRQIVHFLLPGDLITPDMLVISRLDHSIEALTTATVRRMAPGDVLQAINKSTWLATALWWAAELEDAVLREQIVRLGRRAAAERIPHLLLELHRRLVNVRQASPDSFISPLTQEDIGDALGLTNVTVSRILSQLRAQGLITGGRGLIHIPDVRRLAQQCDFDDRYFHPPPDADYRHWLTL